MINGFAHDVYDSSDDCQLRYSRSDSARVPVFNKTNKVSEITRLQWGLKGSPPGLCLKPNPRPPTKYDILQIRLVLTIINEWKNNCWILQHGAGGPLWGKPIVQKSTCRWHLATVCFHVTSWMWNLAICSLWTDPRCECECGCEWMAVSPLSFNLGPLQGTNARRLKSSR